MVPSVNHGTTCALHHAKTTISSGSHVPHCEMSALPFSVRLAPQRQHGPPLHDNRRNTFVLPTTTDRHCTRVRTSTSSPSHINGDMQPRRFSHPRSCNFLAYCPDRYPTVQYGTTTSWSALVPDENSWNFLPVFTACPRSLFSNSSLRAIASIVSAPADNSPRDCYDSPGVVVFKRQSGDTHLEHTHPTA